MVTKALQLKDDTLKLDNLSLETHQSPRIPEFRDRSLKLASNDFESSEKIIHRGSDILDEFYQNLKREEFESDEPYSHFHKLNLYQ